MKPKSNLGKTVLCLGLVAATSSLWAALEFAFVGDHADSLYRCGESAAITVTAFEANGQKATAGKLTVQLDPSHPDKPLVRKEIDLAETNPFVVSGTLDKPGFLWVRLSGEAAKDSKRTCQAFGFDPLSIRRACTRPGDFDSWWEAQVEKLEREVPIDVQMTPYPDHAVPGCELFKVSFASFGRRVWGYLSVPTDKSKAPFPVRVRVPGAGMGGWSNQLGRATPNEIVLFLAVYPWEPSWDNWKAECLPKLKKLDAQAREKDGLTQDGGCYQAGISVSREDYYYYSSILGINRAVNWVAQRPDVDRKNFTYNGHSQGGGFGLFLLGLNRNFTRGVILEPALTDLLGCDAGRVSGWPRLLECQKRENVEIVRKWAPYFDGACFADRIRVPVRMIVGFSDTTCPPTAVYSAFNALASTDKEIVNALVSTHHLAADVTDAVNTWELELAKTSLPSDEGPEGYGLAKGGAEVTKLIGVTNFPPENAIYRDPTRPVEERVEDLIRYMDMREKFAVGTMPQMLAAGGIPRIGLADFRTLDGPGGPRTSTSAKEKQPGVTYFPAPIAYAATWNKELVREVGRVLGEETRGCYHSDQVPARMLLGPTVNIARSPLGGRAFENYGEDPVLAGKIAVEFCRGLQSVKVSPCIKHFILNDQEWCRLVIDVNASERALREIYARPFEIAVKEADVWSVMNSYNAIRGQYASCNLPMQQMLFDYGFTGSVFADWSGFKTPELSYNAGTTMWTCHTRNWNEIDELVKKYEAGAFDKARFEDNLRRNLRHAFRVGAFDVWTKKDRAEQKKYEQSVGSKEHLDLAYQTAAESFVLLKNQDGFLPRERSQVRKVALIGPGADQQYSMIGGNGVHQCGGAAAIYPLAEPTVLEICVKEFGRENVIFAPGFRYDVHNKVTVKGMIERDPVAAAKEADLVIFCGGTDHSYDREAAGGGYVLNSDKKDIDLVGPQERLIARVAKANPNIVVALNIGSPVMVEPWDSMVKGILVTWYSGQTGAQALLDTILGRVNPSGKLPYTFGRDLEDWPCHRLGELSYPGVMTNRNVSATYDQLAVFSQQEYLDDIWVGYRGFEHFGTVPKYPFGFGLSYTTFKYEPAGPCAVKVTNVGPCDGRAVVQCYVAKPPQPGVEMPVKELVDFASVALKVGESKVVTFTPTADWTRYWSEKDNGWRPAVGRARVLIGSSSVDLPVEFELEVK